MRNLSRFISFWLLLVSGAGFAADNVHLQLEQAAHTDPACSHIAPFYWEIGSVAGPLYSGQVGKGAPDATTVMPIASATKWLFGAYVVEQRKGQLQPQDIWSLTMRSGYTGFQPRLCVKQRDSAQNTMTVADCFSASRLLAGGNDELNEEHVGKFYYGGGHFQYWGVQNGLAWQNNAQLEQTFSALIGQDRGIAFNSPQLAGGSVTSAELYRNFLQKLMRGDLLLGAMLGKVSVCANPSVCPQLAESAPLPKELPWQYGLGYWIEVDPNSPKRVYSSAGLFGFYPWVTDDRLQYGIVARHDRALLSRPGVGSARCGQVLRRTLANSLK